MTTPSTAPPPDGDPADALPREGDILAGKYRIETVLGQGGMGLVVAAHHTTLRQKVAIKLLLPDAAKRDDATERFLREARAAVSIQSEHVARVTDVGTLDSGSPYMVMEFLTGQDLGVLLAERGPLPIDEAVDYVLQACEAISEAHAIGIIHRDLKPANLFLSRRTDGTPLIKVLDFGLSKVTRPDALDASLTAHNVVMGSPCYMSPEQIRSLKGLDARTDIWALGVILYQLLTGVRPFEAPSLGALFFTIGADPPKPLRERRPEIPRELEAAVLRCLEKDGSRRTQSIAELARALAPFGKQDSFISVERIHRVLSDATPFPARRGSAGDLTDDGPPTVPLVEEELDDNAATIAQPMPALRAESLRPPPGPPPPYAQIPPFHDGAAGGPKPRAPAEPASDLPTMAEGMKPPAPALSSWRPPPPHASVPPPATARPGSLSDTPRTSARPAESAATSAQVKSGSMAAIAAPSAPPPAMQAQRRSNLVTAVVAVALLAVGGVAGLGLRSVTTPAPAAAPAAAPSPVVTAAEPPQPSPGVTAEIPAPTAAVVATASASASATPAVAPSTSASSKPAAPRKK